jgi:hypothetical protein
MFKDDGVKKMLHLIEEAAGRKGADVIRSTPYVEKKTWKPYMRALCG